MRRWSLALLFTLASPALAQAPEPAQAPPAAPAPEAKPPEKKAPPAAEAKPAPTAAAPAAKATPPAPPAEIDEAEGERRKRVKLEARFILENLLAGDAKQAVSELLYPFQLEDKKYGTAEELVAVWVKQLRAKRTDLITLYDIEVMPLADMEKKYGKPPARLGMGNLKDPDIYVAVGNLSGHAAVLLFRAPKDGQAKAFAYTD